MTQTRSPLRLALALGLLLAGSARAGDLTAPAGPDDPGSAMFTLEDLYQRLDSGAPGALRTGPFTEPTSGPGSTGHTLNEVMGKAPATDEINGAMPADVSSGKTFWGLKDSAWGLQTGTAAGGGGGTTAAVPRTGQTSSYATGDDGDLEKGVAWPSPRFTDNGNGSVTDNLTGLIWLKNANCYGARNWTTALADANGLNTGECGLTDGSTAGQWRLPNVKELQSLIDYGTYNPALPSGHPFSGVQTSNYWSSATNADNTSYAWVVYLNSGYMYGGNKAGSYYVWPVRGGQ